MLTHATFRAAARRSLPKSVFDYVGGDADEEVTLAGIEALPTVLEELLWH